MDERQHPGTRHIDSDELSWNEYKRVVLSGLDRLEYRIEKLERKAEEFDRNIGILNLKAGIWSLLGGMIPILILIALKKLGV